MTTSSEAALSTKPMLSQVAELMTALSGFAWPLIIAALIWLLRHRLDDLLKSVLRRIEAASEIEWGSLKLRGAILSVQGDVIKSDGNLLKIAAAEEADFAKRGKIYEDARNLFIVHTIKPSEPMEIIEGLRVVDVSIYIVSHRKRGKLNDIRKVTYYLGDKWGAKKGNFGAIYAIENGSEDFAFTAQMYGACVCTANIEFHDGATYETSRYLDVEMAPVYGLAPKDVRH